MGTTWDAASAGAWVAATLLLARWGWLLSGALFPGETASRRVVHTVVACWACVAAVAMALGSVGALTGFGLLAAVSAVAVVGLWAVRQWQRRVPAAPGRPGAEGRTWGWTLAWGLVVGFWVARGVHGGLLRFPNDWDSMMYHIPLVDHWLQAGSLYAPDCSFWSFPGNNELLGLWLAAPFSGDFLIGLNNWPAVLLLAFGTVELARNLNLEPSLCHLAGLVATANVVVLTQLIGQGNDVAVAALFVASVAYGLRAARGGRRADVAFAAASLGLLAGVKFLALGCALAAWVVMALLIGRLRGYRAGLGAAAAGVLGVAAWAGYWYGRNFLVTGSPLYPLGTTQANDDLSRLYPDMWSTSFVGNGRPEVGPLALTAVWRMTGPCHLAALLTVPVSLAWLLATGLGRREGASPDGPVRVALAALLALSGLVLAVTPFAVEDVPGTLNHLRWAYTPVRYGLAFLTLAVLALAVVLQDVVRWMKALGRYRTYAALALLASVVVVQFGLAARQVEADPVQRGLLAVAILEAGGLLYLLWKMRPAWRPALVVTLLGIVAVGAPLGGGWLSQRWHKGFVPYYTWKLGYAGYAEVSRLDPADTRICVLGERAYPYLGSYRQFRIYQPAYIPSHDWLLKDLQRRDTTLVVTSSSRSGDETSGTNPTRQCYDWVVEHPALFVPFTSEAWTPVFRVNRNALHQAAHGPGHS